MYNSESGENSQEQIFAQDSDLYQFENAQRQQMLRKMNLTGWNQFAVDQTKQVFDYFNGNIQQQPKIQNQKQNIQNQQQNQIKKLRMKDTLFFFQKVKLLVISHVIDSLAFLEYHFLTSQKKLPFILSYFGLKEFEMYNILRKKHICNISAKQLINFIIIVIQQLSKKQNSFNSHEILYSLCNNLGVGFRKLNLLSIEKLKLESFYDLTYKGIKKKKGKVSQIHEILKKKIKQEVQEQSQSNSVYQHLDQYAYSSNQSKINTSRDLNNKKKLIKSSIDSFYQFFCPLQLKWLLFNIETLDIHTIQQTQNCYLDRKAIIGFYTTRIINSKPEYSHLLKLRKLGKIQLKDQIFYADKNQIIQRRRQRLGCGQIYKQIMKLGRFNKPQFIMGPLEKILIKATDDIQEKYYLDNFPLTWQQMRRSQRYIIKSTIPKYMLLKKDAIDIGRQFKDEKVYKKSDLIRLSSKMGWVDVGRMVKQNTNHLKATKNKTGNETKLYCYGQTQPFMLKINPQTGDFIVDQQHNSIYVSPKMICPQNMVIIEQNVDYICKKYKFKHCRIVQGFKKANMRVVPNNIGFIVYKENQKDIRAYYEERIKKMKENKQERQEQQICSLWNKLFKSILLKQEISKLYS